jgi:heterodisulfide reductase subunit A2
MTWRGEDVQEYLHDLINDVSSDENIETFINSRVTKVSGFVGNFRTTIEENGQSRELAHGVTIIATGASEFKPDLYLYGRDSRVMTGLELQKKLIDKDPTLEQASSAVFVQCVGSRIPERPYCSKVCCTESIRSAMTLKEINPQMDISILYRDLRPYGLREDIYREARSKGIHFIRYDFDRRFLVNNDGGGLMISFSDTTLRREIEIRTDLLILATAIVPEKTNPLSQFFKIPQNNDGFFAEAHVKLRPNDFATDGVFLCGLAHAPKPIDESITQAQAAAARAITLLARKRIMTEGTVAYTDPHVCSGCGICISICPYSAPFLNDKTGKAEIKAALCKGCGLCVSSCRSGALYLKGFETSQIMSMINGV